MRRKRLNLSDAVAYGKPKPFAKEHENKDPHPMGKQRFDQLTDLMTRRAAPRRV
jgi:hypothetical protein